MTAALDRYTWDDRREIEKFMEFLIDLQRVPFPELLSRYEQYMGMSLDERRALIRKFEERTNFPFTMLDEGSH